MIKFLTDEDYNTIISSEIVTTLLTEAYQCVAEGLPMPGVMVSPQLLDEWQDSVVFLPI